MGNVSVVLIRHDSLHEIENDPVFGLSISKAINQLATTDSDSVQVSACSGKSSSNAAVVIGHYFHTSDTKIYVFEGNNGWDVEYGKPKPDWSSLTWKMVRDIFSGIIPKRNKI